MSTAKELIGSAQAFLGQLELQTGYKAAICGGFVRDAILNRPYRDVDLYVAGESYGSIHRELTGERANFAKDSVDQSSVEYTHQSIWMQVELEPLAVVTKSYPIFDGHPINLIGMVEHASIDLEEITGRFNFGICQAGITSSSIYVSPDFRKDMDRQQITLLRLDWGREGSMRQYEKLKQKYDWPMVEQAYEQVPSF